MQVSEIMHKGVVTAQISDSIKRVANLMKNEDIGSIPIYKNERAVGFVTDRDIVVSCVAQGTLPDEPISKAMRREIVSIKEKQEVHEAVRLMEEKQISRLLVVDEGMKPVGMLSLKDLGSLQWDERIKSEVLTKIKH